ncbi:hypothetical protein RSJ42_08285 [Methanosarcina hadiensis]|uniref:hypothetical protein n=1 Tax=Methanosarcina hadiensis TaxID=3078083 RepID=UPI0039772B67
MNTCRNCGKKTDDNEKYCEECLAKAFNKKESTFLKSFINTLIFLFVGYIVVSCIFGLIPDNQNNELQTPVEKPVSFEKPAVVEAPKPSLTQEQKNIIICEEVVEEYYNNHKYMLDTYDCDNMAQDVWNILQSKGIPAQIVVGNLELNEKDIKYNYEKSNHAWIIAYPSINGGIALECTGGFVSYDSKYFYGIWFDDPQELRDYDKIYTDYINKYNEYQSSIDYYNKLVEKFNEQDGYTQQYMASGMIVAKNDVEFKEKEFDKARYRLEEANENLKPYN